MSQDEIAGRTPAVPDLGWTTLLLDEWKFRQAHCWRILQNYGLAGVIVSIAPYLDQSIRAGLGDLVLVFPVVGMVVITIALWMFSNEFARLTPVLQAYRKLQRQKGTDYRPFIKHRWPDTMSLGKTIPPLFFLLFLVGSAANAYFLLALRCEGQEAAGRFCAVPSSILEWLGRLF